MAAGRGRVIRTSSRRGWWGFTAATGCGTASNAVAIKTLPKQQTVAVTYYPNGGTGSTNTYNVLINTNYTIQSQGYTRANFEFSHWNTRADGLGTSYTNNQVVYLTANLALYAQWRPITQAPYQVTYYPNGGAGNTNVVTVPANSNYTIQSQGYTRANFEFSHWNTRSDGAGTSYTNNQVVLINANLALYAQWRPITQSPIYVIYDPNGGTGNTNVAQVNPNTNYTIQNQGYTRIDHTFRGWNTMQNGSGTQYNNGQVIFLTNSILLYAQWQRTN